MEGVAGFEVAGLFGGIRVTLRSSLPPDVVTQRINDAVPTMFSVFAVVTRHIGTRNSVHGLIGGRNG